MRFAVVVVVRAVRPVRVSSSIRDKHSAILGHAINAHDRMTRCALVRGHRRIRRARTRPAPGVKRPRATARSPRAETRRESTPTDRPPQRALWTGKRDTPQLMTCMTVAGTSVVTSLFCAGSAEGSAVRKAQRSSEDVPTFSFFSCRGPACARGVSKRT